MGQSLIAWALLFTVDYVEHYGLTRSQTKDHVLEPVRPWHSWDSSNIMTNWALVNLGLHSHHHMRPGIPYEGLNNQAQARVLPFGYSTMVLLALVPPYFE